MALELEPEDFGQFPSILAQELEELQGTRAEDKRVYTVHNPYHIEIGQVYEGKPKKVRPSSDPDILLSEPLVPFEEQHQIISSEPYIITPLPFGGFSDADGWLPGSIQNHEALGSTPSIAEQVIDDSLVTDPDHSFVVSNENESHIDIVSSIEQAAFTEAVKIFQDRSQKDSKFYRGATMAYKRKRTPSRRKSKKGGSKKTSNTDLMGYLNPFLDLDQRIPDGQVVSSLPHRYTNVREMTVPNTKVGHIMIVPGLDTGVISCISDADGSNVQDITHDLYTGFESYVAGAWPPHPTPTESVIDGPATIEFGGDVTKWRIVSQGLRLALLNPDDSNGGWWETCRVGYKLGVEDWTIFSPSANHNVSNRLTAGEMQINGTNAYVRPLIDVFGTFLSGANIAEADNYRTGTLKAIAATAFTLPPYQGNHEFQELDQKYALDPGDSFVTVTGNGSGEDLSFDFKAGEVEVKKFLQGALDLNHDLVYIRVHPSDSNGTNTRLLLQHCANHEICYDVGSTLHKHMRATIQHKDFPKFKAMKEKPGKGQAMQIG